MADELRILLVERTMAHGGGAESLVYDIYRELKKRPGVRVKLLAFQKSELFGINNNSYFEEELANDPDFHFCNSYVNLSVLGKNKYDVSEFSELVKSFKPNIIHSNLFVAEIISRELIFPGIKYFTHCHDNMRQFRNFSLRTLFKKEWLTDFYEKQHLIARYLKCNNNFISISEDTLQYFRHVLPKKLRKNIFSLDNAIVTQKFNKLNHQRDLSKIRIVNVGGFLAKKNQKFMLDIADELLKMGLDVEIKMLGDGAQLKPVNRLIQDRGLQNVVFAPGNVVGVEDFYAAANIYVHVAYYEPFGLVLLEAMASGLPVVTLDGKGNRDLIKQGENGYMIYEQDAKKFADTIAKIISNKQLYEKMSENAVAFAKKYDIEPYVTKLLDIYQKA